jgi:hypothetical protein
MCTLQASVTRSPILSRRRAMPVGCRFVHTLVRPLVLAALVLLTAVVLANRGNAAALRVVQDVPADVRAEMDVTWNRFVHAFAGQLDCVEPVDLMLVRDVADGAAAYQAEGRLIKVEVPTSPARFRESLVHELAHHVEATCDRQQSLRPAFLEAQGFPPGTEWTGRMAWELMPSEHFAEAVVQIVNGERVLHDDIVTLTPEAIALVESWAASGGIAAFP